MKKMEIEYLSIDDIVPYENNPRHNDDAVDHVANSIKEFGFKVPIIIDENNVIVAGHTRIKACKKLGIKDVPCIRANDLTEDQIKAFRLADNKVSELATWDFEKLEIELDNIDIDMSAFGFDISVSDIDLSEPDDADDIPDVKDEPKAKKGDVYQLGNHFLMCGDATNILDVEKLIGDKIIDLALTDPPYGISVVSVNNKIGGGKIVSVNNKTGGGKIVDCNEYIPIKGDETTDTARENYHIINALSKNQIIFGGNYFTDFLSPSRCWAVWDKENTGNFADAELAWTSFDKGVRLYHWLWNGLCRKGDRDTEGIKRIHPTQKPVGMLIDILNDFSKVGDNVIDCFGGSGSTLIACEKTKRNCFMMEYEPHYIDVIIERWEKITGKKAVLINEINNEVDDG